MFCLVSIRPPALDSTRQLDPPGLFQATSTICPSSWWKLRAGMKMSWRQSLDPEAAGHAILPVKGPLGVGSCGPRFGRSPDGGGPHGRWLSKGDALRGRFDSEVVVSGAVVSPPRSDSITPSRTAPPPAASGQVVATPDLAGALIWRWSTIFARTPFPHLALLLEQGALLALRSRCACSQPVVARSPPAPGGRAGRAG